MFKKKKKSWNHLFLLKWRTTRRSKECHCWLQLWRSPPTTEASLREVYHDFHIDKWHEGFLKHLGYQRLHKACPLHSQEKAALGEEMQMPKAKVAFAFLLPPLKLVGYSSLYNKMLNLGCVNPLSLEKWGQREGRYKIKLTGKQT